MKTNIPRANVSWGTSEVEEGEDEGEEDEEYATKRQKLESTRNVFVQASNTAEYLI